MKKIRYLILIPILVSCLSHPKPKGFEMQADIFDNYTFSDTTDYDDIYITDSKSVDSLDHSKFIYDIFRLESKYYPDSIRAYARVYDSNGVFSSNMADPYKSNPNKNYFTKLDEQLGKHYNVKMENIPKFTVREFGKGDSLPYNLLLTIDYSGSMEPVIDIINMGTEMLIKEKYPYDNVGVATFNNKYYLKVPLMSDTTKLLNLVRAKKNENRGLFSGFLDATMNSIDVLSETNKDDFRVLVLFTDGDDNYSKEKIGEIIEKAKKENVNIFTVAFGYSIDENLRYLAEYTGGRFYRAKSKQELLAIIKDIYNSLRLYYLISYKPPVYWGHHEVQSTLSLESVNKELIGIGHYGTDDLFPWSDLNSLFERPILFEYNSDSLLTESMHIIDELVDVLMSKPSIRLEVQGHTDNIGGVEFNMNLSERRAKAVMNAMIERGINERRLRYRGFGYSQPVASNDTEEGRAKNRRTMFKVTAK